MKNRTLILFTLLMILLLTGCSSNDNNDTPQGIDVIGPEGSYEYSIENSWEGVTQVITLYEDGLTITGNAQRNTKIQSAEDVTSVDIRNLNQGDCKIEINLEENFSDFKITFEGRNTINSINAINGIELFSTASNNMLILSSGVRVDNDETHISGGQIQAGYIYSKKNIYISGKTIVILEKKANDSDPALGIWGTRLHSFFGKIYIDLAHGGYVDIKMDSNEFYHTVEACEGIILGEETYITHPKDAVISKYYANYFVYTNDGYDVERVIFEAIN